MGLWAKEMLAQPAQAGSRAWQARLELQWEMGECAIPRQEQRLHNPPASLSIPIPSPAFESFLPSRTSALLQHHPIILDSQLDDAQEVPVNQKAQFRGLPEPPNWTIISPLDQTISIGAWRSPASALAWGARGPGFKSQRPDRWLSLRNRFRAVFLVKFLPVRLSDPSRLAGLVAGRSARLAALAGRGDGRGGRFPGLVGLHQPGK